jgi:hypothetical protein
MRRTNINSLEETGLDDLAEKPELTSITRRWNYKQEGEKGWDLTNG